MATLTIPNTFVNNSGNADATQVNANFTAVASFCNAEVIQRDGSVAFTQIPTLPATAPTLANHAVRKQYVDEIMPAGVIVDFAGNTPPTGWVLCDGTAYDGTVATYSRLYAAIGVTYGGTGATNFLVPNLKGRVTVGRDTAQTEFDSLAETGGAKTHTLTSAEMPTHTHVQDAHNHTITDPGHTHDVTVRENMTAGGSTGEPMISNNTGTADVRATASKVTGITLAATTAVNQNTGGGGAHNNLQPYIVVNKIIKL